MKKLIETLLYELKPVVTALHEFEYRVQSLFIFLLDFRIFGILIHGSKGCSWRDRLSAVEKSQVQRWLKNSSRQLPGVVRTLSVGNNNTIRTFSKICTNRIHKQGSELMRFQSKNA